MISIPNRARSYRLAAVQIISIAQHARPHIIGIKLYPAGMTTNSEAGVADTHAAEMTLAHMEELGIPLLVHGESCGFVLDREAEFLPVVERWAALFPKRIRYHL